MLIASLRCVLSLAVLGLACAQAWAAPIRASFVNPGRSDEYFWVAVTAVMQAAAAQLDIALEVRYAERDRDRMVALGREVTERPDPPGYLIAVNEEGFAVDMLRRADARGIKTLLLLNSLTPEQATQLGRPGERLRNWIGAVQPDNAVAGQRMAELAIAAAAAKGLRDAAGRIQLLAIAGDQLTPASVERTAGLHAALARHPEVTLSRLINSKWTEAEGQQIAERYLAWAARNGVRVGVVWAANDPIAFGAIAALRGAGYTPGVDVLVAGLNWSAPALERVAEGEMLLTDGGHFLAGGWAMVVVRDHANGLPIGSDGTVRFAMSAITGENVARFQRHFGRRDWSAIDFAALARSLGQAPAGYDFTLERIFRAQRPVGPG